MSDANTRDSSDEDENDLSEDNDLIPPFLANQTVFTRSIEQPLSPKSSHSNSAVTSSQGQQTERFFEAIIRQARHHPSDSTWSFKIHFKGWNARYDKWLPASQLLPDTPETREKYEQQQQLEKSQAEAQKQEQLRKQQRKKEQQQQQAKATAELTGAALPFTLKIVLMEEREKITRKGYDAPYGYDHDTMNPSSPPAKPAKGPARSVHSLPAAVTIRQLLKHFEKKTRKDWQQKQDKKNDNEDQKAAASLQFKQDIREFCRGLARLLETALPVCLLYPQERPQYEYYRASQEEQSSLLDVYGCEFLLRLLVRLPQLMGKPPPQFVGDLVVVLQQNRQACFKGKFRPPTYPHEWLEWEKKYYGDPALKETKKDVETVEEVGEEDNSDEDLFS